jgi:DNA-binding NarL/FixJ family response regulator
LWAELTPRQRAITTFMVEGKSGAAMAKTLKVSDSAIQTGKRHLTKAIGRRRSAWA